MIKDFITPGERLTLKHKNSFLLSSFWIISTFVFILICMNEVFYV